MKSRARSGGFTLVEVLGYAAILIVILNLSASVLIGTRRLHALGTLALDRNEAIERVARDFRQAVHQSSGIAENVAGIPQIPGSLALKAKGSGATARYFLWRREPDGRFFLDEYAIGADRAVSLLSREVYPRCLEILEFSVTRDPDTAALVQLDLVIDTEGTRRSVPAKTRFVAAMSAP